jgi:hypothetical protein
MIKILHLVLFSFYLLTLSVSGNPFKRHDVKAVKSEQPIKIVVFLMKKPGNTAKSFPVSNSETRMKDKMQQKKQK